MGKLKRPLKGTTERPIYQDLGLAPANDPYFTDDATTDEYYVDDSQNNRYETADT